MMLAKIGGRIINLHNIDNVRVDQGPGALRIRITTLTDTITLDGPDAHEWLTLLRGHLICDWKSPAEKADAPTREDRRAGASTFPGPGRE